MEPEIYRELTQMVRDEVDKISLSLWETLIEKSYHPWTPKWGDFNNHRKSITINYYTRFTNKPIVIAEIRKGRDNGLDGEVYSIAGKKAGEQIKSMIHSFAHKYNISTGNLL